jgi:hypothetical protein
MFISLVFFGRLMQFCITVRCYRCVVQVIVDTSESLWMANVYGHGNIICHFMSFCLPMFWFSVIRIL